VNTLGQTIAIQTARSELTFHIGILDTDEVNAFACPGGYIMLTKGVLKQMQNESELAFVLAHEISHVALQHSGRFQQTSGIVSFISSFLGGGTVVSVAVRRSTGELEAQLLEKGRQKEFEFDADKAGVVLAANLGYDPSSSINYLKRVSEASGNQILIRTHPSFAERIVSINQFILAQGYSPTVVTLNQQRFEKYRNLIQ